MGALKDTHVLVNNIIINSKLKKNLIDELEEFSNENSYLFKPTGYNKEALGNKQIEVRDKIFLEFIKSLDFKLSDSQFIVKKEQILSIEHSSFAALFKYAYRHSLAGLCDLNLDSFFLNKEFSNLNIIKSAVVVKNAKDENANLFFSQFPLISVCKEI